MVAHLGTVFQRNDKLSMYTNMVVLFCLLSIRNKYIVQTNIIMGPLLKYTHGAFFAFFYFCNVFGFSGF